VDTQRTVVVESDETWSTKTGEIFLSGYILLDSIGEKHPMKGLEEKCIGALCNSDHERKSPGDVIE
jgi:hypothetical protein